MICKPTPPLIETSLLPSFPWLTTNCRSLTQRRVRPSSKLHVVRSLLRKNVRDKSLDLGERILAGAAAKTHSKSHTGCQLCERLVILFACKVHNKFGPARQKCRVFWFVPLSANIGFLLLVSMRTSVSCLFLQVWRTMPQHEATIWSTLQFCCVLSLQLLLLLLRMRKRQWETRLLQQVCSGKENLHHDNSTAKMTKTQATRT